MGNIRVLPPLLRDQIAAGEVCERPASVAKELIENSLDAGAENISVWVEHGGIVSLRVSDDGYGMEAGDAEMCFARHATSKLAEDNLNGIFTMGFRGEALAAISAVSKIKMLTRAKGSLEGTAVQVEAGNILSLTPAGCPEGTNITVSDLFYNTPARLKFLKRDISEAGMVESVVEKAAFAHPEVSFRMYRDGKETLHTPGDGNLLSVIYCIYGREYASKILPFRNEYNGVIAKGYVCQPTAGRGNRSMQFFSVNGRPVRSKMLSAALDESYKNAMPYGKYAFCFLDISLSYELVDVNVHPQKSEVRFVRDRDVFDTVYFGVKNLWSAAKIESIEDEKYSPSVPDAVQISFEPSNQTAPRADSPAEKAEFPQKAEPEPSASYTPKGSVLQSPGAPIFFKDLPEEDQEEKLSDAKPSFTSPEHFPAKDESVPAVECESEPPIEENAESLLPQEAPYRFKCELFHTYIVAEGEDALYIIDKHAAHERMIYEELLLHEGEAESQMLLTPFVCRLSRDEYFTLLASFEELDKAGFELEDFGSNSLLVRRIPACLTDGDIAASLSEISQSISEGKHDKRLSIRERLLYSVACRAAIKGGDRSTQSELDMICSRVLDFQDIRFCPHGRPCVFRITKSEIEKRFGRLG